MANTKLNRLKGFIRYSLAHHPICWQYRNHLIKFKGWYFCLGCTGFYSGFLAGIVLIFGGLFSKISWINLIFIAIIFWIPTILRLVNIKYFNTPKRSLRLIFRFLLGIGIALGIYSIFFAPTPLLQIIQILIGLLFYGIITVYRVRNGPQEWNRLCETCTFTRSKSCPGLSPLFIWRT